MAELGYYGNYVVLDNVYCFQVFLFHAIIACKFSRQKYNIMSACKFMFFKMANLILLYEMKILRHNRNGQRNVLKR